jgi:O-antigen ligase
MDILIFIYLSIFPMGKLLGNASDILIMAICLLAIIKKVKFRLNNFILICGFSLLFSLSFFKFTQIFTGILYFLRLISYFMFSQIVFDKFGKTQKKRKFIFGSLIIIGIFIAIFGWIQYFLFPDLRALKTLGWDDHYFRLVSTYLDPAFTGILLVLTEILVIIKTSLSLRDERNTKVNFGLNIFLIITILFTYSRSSYLALLITIIILFIKFKKKFILILGILFVLLIPILPNPGGEGVNLKRTSSVVYKFLNYNQSFDLIKKSPLFGIGYNNICVSTTGNIKSHACSGLDNSILFIIATTGIVGLIVFVHLMISIINATELDLYGWGLVTSFIAIFIHGMFTETFFYSFILGWIAILIGITRKRSL